MAIGRIGGPLLKSNLVRTPLPENERNLAFENDLLYLNFDNLENHRVGVKTDSPAYDLDVNGTINARYLVRGAEAQIDEVNIDNNKIQSIVGDLILKTLVPTDRVRVEGNLWVTGDIQADGTLTLGNEDTDNVSFGADINSNIIPDVTETYTLGSPEKHWKTLYVKDLFINEGLLIGDFRIGGNTIETLSPDSDIILRPAPDGRLIINANSALRLPVGTTAQRPDPAQVGDVRLNSDTSHVENYNGLEWNTMAHEDDAIAYAIALG